MGVLRCEFANVSKRVGSGSESFRLLFPQLILTDGQDRRALTAVLGLGDLLFAISPPTYVIPLHLRSGAQSVGLCQDTVSRIPSGISRKHVAVAWQGRSVAFNPTAHEGNPEKCTVSTVSTQNDSSLRVRLLLISLDANDRSLERKLMLLDL